MSSFFDYFKGIYQKEKLILTQLTHLKGVLE